MASQRSQRSYDHRLVRLVQETRNPTIATRLGVPRSTVAGWLRRAPRPVTAVPREEETLAALRGRVARLERRCQRLAAVLHLPRGGLRSRSYRARWPRVNPVPTRATLAGCAGSSSPSSYCSRCA